MPLCIGDDERRRDGPATPIRPEGCGGTEPTSLSLLLADGLASTRRRFANSARSRSQQLLTYSWDRTPEQLAEKRRISGSAGS